MQSKVLRRIVAVLALAALAMPVFAKPIHRDITLSRAVKFGKTQIEAGAYVLLVDGSRVTLKQGRKIVAEIDATWEERETAAPYGSVLINRYGQIEEVRFRGSNRVLVIPRL